jgi:coat protein Gp5
MALNNFIPQIWAARLLRALEKSLVYGSAVVINRDYEGEIQGQGDSVRINSIGDPTISDYTRNTDISAPEALQDASQVLTIDRAKYFNFAVDDVDKAQMKPKVMDEAMSRAGYGLRNAADTYIAALYSQAAAVTGLGDDTTPLVPTSTTAYEYLVDMGVKLDEANVPAEGRWCILPPWYEGLLLKDARFVSFGTEANQDHLQNGMIGRAAGMLILKSNNVPNTSGAKYKVIAGHPMAWSYAEQIVKVEAYRPERRFSDALKGLHVYGSRVVRPDCLVVGTFSKS